MVFNEMQQKWYTQIDTYKKTDAYNKGILHFLCLLLKCRTYLFMTMTMEGIKKKC